jgi:mRNA interferase RelE/StbE
MAVYRIVLAKSVNHDVRTLPKRDLERVIEALQSLADNPFPPNARKLTGAEALYRLRVGSYRIVYEVDHGAREIGVHYIRHRKDAYRKP